MIRAILTFFVISVLFGIVFFYKKIIEEDGFDEVFQIFDNSVESKSIKSEKKSIVTGNIEYVKNIDKALKNHKGDKFYQYFKLDNGSSKYKIGNKTRCHEIKNFNLDTLNFVVDYIETINIVLDFNSLSNVDYNKNIDMHKTINEICSEPKYKNVVIYEAIIYTHMKSTTIVEYKDLNLGYIKAKKEGLFKNKYFPNFVEKTH